MTGLNNVYWKVVKIDYVMYRHRNVIMMNACLLGVIEAIKRVVQTLPKNKKC